MRKKKKLRLEDLKVQSFVTEFNKDSGETLNMKGGWSENCTGNCGTPISWTCGGGCDFQSIPINECFPQTQGCSIAVCQTGGCTAYGCQT